MFDFELLERHLNSDDPVAVLLRGHLWIERMLVELIQAELAIPDAWPELDRLSWSSKLRLAQAQGNAPPFKSFVVLNRLRNRLAHSPSFEPDLAASMELAHAVETDMHSNSNVYDVEFDLPNADVATPTEILRASISTLLDYLTAALLDLYEALTRRANDGAERMRAFLDTLPASHPDGQKAAQDDRSVSRSN